jgi:hypothetical protein
MELHGFGVDVGFKRRVVVGKRWKFVSQSVSSWISVLAIGSPAIETGR